MNEIAATYRGFRRQAIYALVRILEASSGLGSTFQPEGVEDLAVYDPDGKLIEVIQVKDYGRPLVLSDFNPKQPSGFFARLIQLQHTQPEVLVRLVYFGELGTELDSAFRENGDQRMRVARKVARHGYATDQSIADLLDSTAIERVDEDDLLSRIDSCLRQTAVGIDRSIALDLMTWWLYRSSESQQIISYNEVSERILYIGRFIHERRSHYNEWFINIEPLADVPNREAIRETLMEEFSRGVAVDYTHIVESLDVIRGEKLEVIDERFSRNRVVVLRGASGQGKSALAYRYLHDYVPQAWRFRVKLVEDRGHALTIATALLSHASALQAPLVVLLDVSSNDDAWPELVQELARHRAVKVLVAIREEDWRKTQIYGHQFDFAEIALDFDRDEAKRIWDGIPVDRRSAKFRRFEDAWGRFGQGTLLLEFVHLVTEGTTLRERLRQQIDQRQQDERTGRVRASELQLLRLVSVVSEYGGRLRTQPTIESLSLAAPSLVIASMEREYLLRTTGSGEYLEGLHPVRSKILTDLLIDAGVPGASWHEIAAASLHLIDPNDVGDVLLSSAVHREDEFEALLPKLRNFTCDRWVAVGGVVRTLLWRGIRHYVNENQEVIAAAIRDSGTGWWVILDSDLSEAMPGAQDERFKLFEGIVSPERMAKILELGRSQLPKDYAFMQLRAWLSEIEHTPEHPEGIEDWRGFAEASFWAGRLGVPWSLGNLISLERLREIEHDLPLTILADVVAGMWEADQQFTSSWLTTYRQVLVHRLRHQEWIVRFDDDERTLTARFLISPWLDRIWSAKPTPLLDNDNLVHNEALMRIDLMRRLFPDRVSYACQGYGHLAPRLDLKQDDSFKSGIPQSRLPIRWAPHANGIFTGLVEHSHRPSDWRDYGKLVLDLREEVARVVGDLSRGIEKYLASPTAIQVLNSEVSGKKLFDLWNSVRLPPLLP